MSYSLVQFRELRADTRGIQAIEYGIMASIIGVVLLGVFSSFGQTITTLFTAVSSSL